MRTGYWLTALAAIVLLAASPGTASAQSVGFVGSSSRTMEEGASPAMTTAAPIEVEFRISGLVLAGDDADPAALGVLRIQHNADVAPPGTGDAGIRTAANRRIWIDSNSPALDETMFDMGDFVMGDQAAAPHDNLYGLDPTDAIPYDANGVVKLVIIDPGGDGDWVNTKFTMTLRADANGVSPSPAAVTVTMTDGDPQPTVSFSRTSLALTEETQTATPVSIKLGAGKTGTTDDPAGMSELMNTIRFTTSPKGAAVFETCVKGKDDDVIALTFDPDNGITKVTDKDDTWEVTGRAGQIPAVDGALTIAIEACGDMSGFTDEMVTFSFVAKSLEGLPDGLGDVGAGADLVVTVRSVGEDKPEVTFSTTSLSIAEGDTSTVAIIADGKLGPEVGSVTVSVSDDGAMLSLLQGMDMLDADEDGMYEVELGDSANTILTVMADDDPALDDGMTATATLTIESASGAIIGARNSLAVTVSGVTQETDPDEGDEDSEPDRATRILSRCRRCR